MDNGNNVKNNDTEIDDNDNYTDIYDYNYTEIDDEKDVSEFCRLYLDEAPDTLSTYFKKHNELLDYERLIQSKTYSLNDYNFLSLNYQQRLDWFSANLEELKASQQNHFHSLHNYRINIMAEKFHCMIYYRFLTNELRVDASGEEYKKKETSYFIQQLKAIKSLLSKFVKLFDFIKKDYEELNKHNQTLLKILFKTFSETLKVQRKKEKIDQSYLNQFIPMTKYETIEDQINLFLTDEIVFTNQLKKQELQQRMEFKKTTLEHFETFFKKLKENMLSRTYYYEQYENFVPYLKKE